MNLVSMNEKGIREMDKLEGLRAGVEEMRSVAQRLNQWADDLEHSFQVEEAPEKKVEAGKPAANEKKRKAAAGRAPAEPAPTQETGKAFTLPEVRAILAEKCAAGYSAQVKALIEAYGVSTLKEVPADCYGELLDAVKDLGDADAG